MQIVKLRKIKNSIAVTLPASVIEALHLREDDELAIEIAGDCIMGPSRNSVERAQ